MCSAEYLLCVIWLVCHTDLTTACFLNTLFICLLASPAPTSLCFCQHWQIQPNTKEYLLLDVIIYSSCPTVFLSIPDIILTFLFSVGLTVFMVFLHKFSDTGHTKMCVCMQTRVSFSDPLTYAVMSVCGLLFWELIPPDKMKIIHPKQSDKTQQENCEQPLCIHYPGQA